MYIDLELMTISSDVRRGRDVNRVKRPSRLLPPGSSRSCCLSFFPTRATGREEEYLWLTDHTNRYVEFTDGFIEVLPMPTDRHQTIL